METKTYDVFIISPVRNITDEQKLAIENHIQGLKEEGFTVYFPLTDTNQEDPTLGYNICYDNREAMENSKEVHIYFDKKSEGSLFDLGMAFALNKSITIINVEDLESSEVKSVSNLIAFWEMVSDV